ncbi:unnamed protein product [Caenorhabditis sp. 36 PRJEB53466]|nr:unnamed protein product [Caenorhabditis sp. 36 PRJEB53466]
MLLVSLFSLFSVGFGMRIARRDLDDVPTTLLLELGPLAVVPSDDDFLLLPADVSRDKRGVDPLSIPRLIKEPPLKKRSDFKRGDVVYPSAAKQTVPLVRVREPPLKRGQLFLEEILQFNEANRQFMNPMRRIRYGTNRHIYSW